MKDMNLLKINSQLNQALVNFPDTSLIDIIAEDSLFLMGKNLMDYSLLLVIEHVKDQKPDKVRRGQVFTQTQLGTRAGSNQVYHLAIIDYLQEYNLEKRIENLFKTKVLFKGQGISAINAKDY